MKTSCQFPTFSTPSQDRTHSSGRERQGAAMMAPSITGQHKNRAVNRNWRRFQSCAKQLWHEIAQASSFWWIAWTYISCIELSAKSESFIKTAPFCVLRSFLFFVLQRLIGVQQTINIFAKITQTFTKFFKGRITWLLVQLEVSFKSSVWSLLLAHNFLIQLLITTAQASQFSKFMMEVKLTSFSGCQKMSLAGEWRK